MVLEQGLEVLGVRLMVLALVLEVKCSKFWGLGSRLGCWGQGAGCGVEDLGL